MNFYTYEGKITFPDQAPSLKSIAVSLARESRYAGASLYWWPVALHTFVVCDLLPDHLKLHGLLHDAAEVVTGDIPKPAKTPQADALEADVLAAIYCSLDLIQLSSQDAYAVKQADYRALHGEVHTVGTFALREVYPHDHEAETLVWTYFKRFHAADCLNADGACVAEFLRRFEEYRR